MLSIIIIIVFHLTLLQPKRPCRPSDFLFFCAFIPLFYIDSLLEVHKMVFFSHLRKQKEKSIPFIEILYKSLFFFPSKVILFETKQTSKNLVGHCLTLQNTTDYVAYKQQKVISHSSGTCNSKMRVSTWSSKGLLSEHRLPLVSSYGRKVKGFLCCLFHKDTYPFPGGFSLLSNHLPKPPPPTQYYHLIFNIWIQGKYIQITAVHPCPPNGMSFSQAKCMCSVPLASKVLTCSSINSKLLAQSLL